MTDQDNPAQQDHELPRSRRSPPAPRVSSVQPVSPGEGERFLTAAEWKILSFRDKVELVSAVSFPWKLFLFPQPKIPRLSRATDHTLQIERKIKLAHLQIADVRSRREAATTDEEKDRLHLEIRFVRMKCEGLSKAMDKLERGVDVTLEEFEAEERERDSGEQGA